MEILKILNASGKVYCTEAPNFFLNHIFYHDKPVAFYPQIGAPVIEDAYDAEGNFLGNVLIMGSIMHYQIIAPKWWGERKNR